jgi:hypothetical protein
MRVFGGHRPVDERARHVAVAQGRFAVLSPPNSIRSSLSPMHIG